MTIPSNIDHFILAGINSMCRVVRDYVLQELENNDKKSINKILDEFMYYHNTIHYNIEYKKQPVDITEEEV